MIKNIGKDAKFFCMNGHEKPIPFNVWEGTDNTKDNFFACPKYMAVDEKHPDGRLPGEKACQNRLSFSDAGDIIKKFGEIVEDDLKNNFITEYEGYTFWLRKHIKVTVLKYGRHGVHFGIYNKKAIES